MDEEVNRDKTGEADEMNLESKTVALHAIIIVTARLTD